MKKLLVLLLVAAGTVTGGCATLNTLTATQSVLLNDAVELGAAVYISKASGGTTVAGKSYTTAQQARAQQVKNIATEIEAVAAGTATAAQLTAAVSQWATKLNPTEQLIVGQVLADVTPLIQAQLGKGVLGAAATAAVDEVMGDWVTAAQGYGAV